MGRGFGPKGAASAATQMGGKGLALNDRLLAVLEQGCVRTLIDKLGSCLGLLGDTFRPNVKEEMLSWLLCLGPTKHFLLPSVPVYVSKQAQF